MVSSGAHLMMGEGRRWLYGAKHLRSGRGASLPTVGVDTKMQKKEVL